MFQLPSNENEWKTIAADFEKRWNFPNCLGAVDGKHIKIKPPPESGSYFFNYKHFHSQVLMAVANANYELIYFHFGTNGRVSDGGVIRNTDFYQKLMNGTLGLPQPSPVNGITLPYVYVGDDAFALRNDFLKPFNRSQLNEKTRIFNYRLSRARRIIENVFGILVARFGILKNEINLDLDKIAPVVMACCALHNFLRRENPDTYSPQDSFDRENYELGEIEEGLQSITCLVLREQDNLVFSQQQEIGTYLLTILMESVQFHGRTIT